jgi:hypothetical protein
LKVIEQFISYSDVFYFDDQLLSSRISYDLPFPRAYQIVFGNSRYFLMSNFYLCSVVDADLQAKDLLVAFKHQLILSYHETSLALYYDCLNQHQLDY